MKLKNKNITAISLFTALALACGYALISIPNVEMLTVTVFSGGVILGVKNGIVVGLLSEALFALLNPFGISPPPLFIAQVIAVGLIGFAGGLYGKLSLSRPLYLLLLSVAGFSLSLLLSLVTTAGYGLAAGFSPNQLFASFLSGIVFDIIHSSTNALIYPLIVPLYIQLSKKTFLDNL